MGLGSSLWLPFSSPACFNTLSLSKVVKMSSNPQRVCLIFHDLLGFPVSSLQYATLNPFPLWSCCLFLPWLLLSGLLFLSAAPAFPWPPVLFCINVKTSRTSGLCPQPYLECLLAVVCFLCGLVTLTPQMLLQVCLYVMLFENLHSGAHCLYLCLATKVDL